MRALDELTQDPDRMLRLPEVLAITGLSRATVYAMVAAGEFPAPVRLGARAVGWWLSEIVVWLRSRPRASEGNWR